MKRHAITVVAATSIVAAGAGVALAYFTGGTGSGSGTGSTGTIAVSLLSTTGTVTNLLYPGGSGDLIVKVHNPNTFAVSVTSVGPGTGNATATGGTGTCTTTGVSANTTSVTGETIAAGQSLQFTVADGASMSASSQAGCQGATFTVPVQVTVQS
jgi:hypothetical protein